MFYWIYDYPNLIMGPLFAAGFVLTALIGQFVFRALLAKWVPAAGRHVGGDGRDRGCDRAGLGGVGVAHGERARAGGRPGGRGCG